MIYFALVFNIVFENNYHDIDLLLNIDITKEYNELQKLSASEDAFNKNIEYLLGDKVCNKLNMFDFLTDFRYIIYSF